MHLIKIVPYILLSCIIAGPSLAHEFWIAPKEFVYAPEAKVQADLKVGQNFSGSGYSYNPRNFTRFETLSGTTLSEVSGRLGDVPALQLDGASEGLLTIIHETDDSSLTYSVWEKFVKFVDHKAFPTTLDDHVARGIPKDEKFVESYKRYAKSLIAIGNGAGNDTEVGLETEIIALQNPYATDENAISVKVLLAGDPKPDTQVELFEKSPSGDVEITLYRTNAEGIATLPVKRGYSYLVDSVSMLPTENDDPTKGPVWKSLWASLTFMVPETPLK